MKLQIIMRTHDGSNVHTNKRFIEDSKADIVKKCLYSVVDSVKNSEYKDSISLKVIDDHSSGDTINFIKNCIHSINSELIELENNGNNASMKKSYELALTSDSNLLYLVEDDYWHKTETINIMLKDYDKFSKKLDNQPLVLVPYDDSVDYRPDRVMPARIVAGTDRHWRQNFHTTFSMMMSKWVLLHFWDIFMSMSNYGNEICEDNTINLLYRKFDVVLLSPMPWLAAHMGDSEPVVGEWKKYWEKSLT